MPFRLKHTNQAIIRNIHLQHKINYATFGCVFFVLEKGDIFREGNTVIAGDEFDAMSEAELDEAVKTTTVFARVSPKEKLAIINSLKRDKEVAA